MPVLSALLVARTLTRGVPAASMVLTEPLRPASGARASKDFALMVAMAGEFLKLTSARALPP
jgi:hypothetical protein